MNPFRGLSAFPITPADPQGQLLLPDFTGLMQRLVGSGVESICVLGSTGTYAYLTRAERRGVVEAAAQMIAGKLPLIAGIGALRTDEALALGQDAQTAGADAVLLAPVSYTPLTDDEVFAHFATIAKSLRVPLCIYNNPGTTHFSFSTALIARLSQIENITAVKNPSPAPVDAAAQIADLRARTKPGFSLGYAADWHAAEALIAGGDGWSSVLAGLFPAPCLAITQALAHGDITAARIANAGLQPLWDLFKELSSLRVIYAAARLVGVTQAQPPLPILPLSAENVARLARVLEDLGLKV